MYISGKGLFLPSAHRVELEAHCDDDKRNHLESTWSRHGLQSYVDFLSVETRPVRLEFLH